METPSEQARQLFIQGIDHFESGRLVAARDAFATALALVPGRPSLLANLAAVHFRLQEFAEARSCFEQLLASEAGNPDNWISLGLCEEALGHWQAAAEALERGLASRPDAALWLRCSNCRGRLGQLPAALAAVDKALQLAPTDGLAWSARGSLLREMQQFAAAAECFEKALAHGADTELNRYYLASVRGDGKPQAPPRQYVEALFDDYAADFQSHLVEGLRYRGHETLVQPLLAAATTYGSALDLGCGTGLCGALIRPLCTAIDGVDLSAAMLDQARTRGIYRQLAHDELAAFLNKCTGRYELILAADVFGYIGDLSGIFRSVRRLLQPGGRFAFTVEQATAGNDFNLLPNLRYTHTEAYIRRLAADSSFTLRTLSAAPLRYDQTQPVMALYVHLD